MDNLIFKRATLNDTDYIKKLLAKYDLPSEDISEHLEHFFIAEIKNKLIGVVGLELYGEFGLLRSLAVESSYRNKKIGKQLYNQIAMYAIQRKIEKLYLLTTTAATYFIKLGFKEIDRNKVPIGIQSTNEFQNLCPSTAICMMKKLE
jgi:amino-acid N-acetyltransferase